MSIINELVFDRTEGDVTELRTLRSRILANGFTSLTDEERAKWLGGMKAAYNSMDLNRVGEAVNFLRDELATLDVWVDVTGKTDWVVGETPSAEEMAVYLQNLETIRAALPVETDLTPSTLRWLDIEKMNSIEKILYDVGKTVLLIQEAWFSCGELACGES